MKAQVARTQRIARVAITRSRKGNAALAEQLRDRGFEPVAIDTIEFLPPEDWSAVDQSLRRLGGFDWVLFTSATGVEFFASRCKELSLGIPWRGKPSVAAVGDKTAAALEARGLKADFVPSSFLTTALAEELPRNLGLRLLVLRADIGDPGFVPALQRNGFAVTDHAIYRTASVSGQEGPLPAADAILFASPSAVEALMKRPVSAHGSPLDSLAICIGPVTAMAARGHGFERVTTAKVHTIEGLLDALADASEGS